MDNFDKKLIDSLWTMVKNGDIDITPTSDDEKEETIKTIEKAVDIINNTDYTGIIREKITKDTIEE